jgi:hypothetical protein
VSQSVCNLNYVAIQAREAWGALYSPQGNLLVEGVRDTDMSRLGAGHVQPRSLEPGLGTEQVWFRDLIRVKVERPNMSRLGAGYVRDNSLEPR